MWRRWDKRGKQEGQKMGRVNGIYLSEGRIRDGEIWGEDVIFSNAGRERRVHMRRNKEKSFCGCMARDGGGGGGRREEGTSALALCIGGVEAEVRQEWGDMKGLP
ncbi:uncharacterized protein MONOS_18235 [Monocercomonoides exilis]|uniref:uncharacterized protein n=1 Tax=Monocercomonoides exilis TaxID=2049356 RepID=UPI00355A32C7|nr:hypothetical protein MONOS_18235 [Monocercomonoides exilis]